MEDQNPRSTSHSTLNGEIMESTLFDKLADKDDSDKNFCQMPGWKKLSYFTFFFVIFFVGMFYSLMAPFFPNEAQTKGVSYTVIGLIFSVYPAVSFITSPLIGRHLSTIGAKFALTTAIFSCGSSAILYGCLEYVYDGTPFAILAVLIRVFQATACATLNTTIFAMVGTLFPKQISTLMALIEVGFALGVMMGPPIGGWWYELGGFKLPFFVSGTVLLITGLVCAYFLPDLQVEQKPHPRSTWKLLLKPLLVIVGLTTASASFCIGFVDVSLSIRLEEKYNLGPVWIGMMFVLAPAVYVITAPMWGFFADKKPAAAPIVMGTGMLVTGLSFWLVGPADFLHIPDTLFWLVMFSCCLSGLGLGPTVVNIKIMAEVARQDGHPTDLDTMGMLAGLLYSFTSFGLFCGPLIGGFLNEHYQFPGAAFIVGIICFSMGTILLLYTLIQYLLKQQTYNEPPGEMQRLLPDDNKDASAHSTSEPIILMSSIPIETQQENDYPLFNQESKS